MRPAAEVLVAQAHAAQHLARRVLACGGVAFTVDEQRLQQRVADGLPWVERAVGVLKDDLHGAPQLAADHGVGIGLG